MRGASLCEVLRTGSDPAWDKVCLFNSVLPFQYLRVPSHSEALVHRSPATCLQTFIKSQPEIWQIERSKSKMHLIYNLLAALMMILWREWSGNRLT